ncbi:MAG: DUF2934 domain-containing protein [Methylophilus sp.]|nr:DUF2934 domain-containing protein [Methylophilus sp.]
MNPLKATSNTAKNLTLITPSDPALQQSNEERLSHIAESAYYKAEARGFSSGYELDDWLAAEAEEK